MPDHTPLLNQEAALLAQAQAAEAQRKAAQWQSPIVADREIPDLVGFSPTQWDTQKAAGDTPKLFTIGRRQFCWTEDLRAWLREKARHGAPGNRRMRERQRTESGELKA